ncbi:MAG: molybdopterin-dependent oxidoreductase, partial [Metallibacterium scheffleri]|uniref:molybdopterin-dependent oxidoreductase n=1 Tax=Metallibacterium scheffleri TaxID=993689 RepID=UPI0026E9227B
MLRVSIDGKPLECADGITILDALRQAGAAVPQLCHDHRLAPSGACRMCVVEIAGQPRPVASCTTPVAHEMDIRTRTPELEALRRTNLELVAGHYPAEAVAGQPGHPFHRLLAEYGLQAQGARQAEVFRDDSHPYIGVDMDRCIQCQRCVRICDELQGQSVWGAWERDGQMRIAPRRGATLIEAGCVACGACVDTCPTGALFDKRAQPALQQTRTTCVYCGVGCQMDVGSRDGSVVQVSPADSPVNRGHLCVKGRYAWEFAAAPDRVTTPMIREQGAWRRASWEEALDFAASRLKRILERDGADAIGVLGSARATNEENYLVQKLARAVLGTNNVDSCARVCHTPTAKAMKDMLGTGAATNAFDDIERTAAFLIVGCNPTENHPIVGARIRQAVLKGARLVVIDPRRTELAALADVHLAVRPGHNVPLFNAIAATILEEGLGDRDFLDRRVEGLEAFAVLLRDYAPERVAESCGLAAADIRAAARIYADAKPAMCFHGLGVTEHLQGTEGVMALINLALLTGNLGVPGAG